MIVPTPVSLLPAVPVVGFAGIDTEIVKLSLFSSTKSVVELTSNVIPVEFAGIVTVVLFSV